MLATRDTSHQLFFSLDLFSRTREHYQACHHGLVTHKWLRNYKDDSVEPQREQWGLWPRRHLHFQTSAWYMILNCILHHVLLTINEEKSIWELQSLAILFCVSAQMMGRRDTYQTQPETRDYIIISAERVRTLVLICICFGKKEKALWISPKLTLKYQPGGEKHVTVSG